MYNVQFQNIEKELILGSFFYSLRKSAQSAVKTKFELHKSKIHYIYNIHYTTYKIQSKCKTQKV